MILRTLPAVFLLAVIVIACGTHLASTSLRDEQSGATISAAGYHAHADGGPDQLRYLFLYCKSREVILQGGDTVTDAGVPCH